MPVIRKQTLNWAEWSMPVISALEGEVGDGQFQASLGCGVGGE
jgi:hypothetical protein